MTEMLAHKGLLSVTGTGHQAGRISDQTRSESSATAGEKLNQTGGREGLNNIACIKQRRLF